MATLDDVARIALALPQTTETDDKGRRSWQVAAKAFAWERRFSKADLKRFGSQPPPEEPVLAVWVADLGEKESILAAGHPGFFTISHFDGYAAVLVALGAAEETSLARLIEDGWLAKAPPAVAEEWADRR